MRKGTMMVALVALLVAIFATAAYAAVIEGDGGNNDLDESTGNGVNDQMYGYGGEDRLEAWQYTDDRDKLYGGRGKDDLDVADGDPDDVADGGRGEESTCYADVGDEVHRCDGNVTWFK